MQKAILLASLVLTGTVGAAQFNSPSTTSNMPSQNMNAQPGASVRTGGTNSTVTSTTATPREDRFITGTDQQLGSQIRDKLNNMIGQSDAKEIVLTVDAGHVKLLGKVPSEDLKAQITQNLQQINGVKSVINRLEVNKAKSSVNRP